MVLVETQIKRLVYLALYALYQKARMMVLPLLVVPTLVFLMALSSEKLYTNHATILIEESALLNPFLDDLSFSFELSDRMDALRTLVLSRKVLNAVAKDAGLVEQDAPLIEIDKMQQKLSQAISLSLVGDELVRIHFKWPEREQMKPVLEQVVEKFIERLLAPTKASLDTSEQFFADQLGQIRTELEGAEDKLARFKSDNRDALPELLAANQEALQRLEKQRQLKTVQLSGTQAKFDTLSSKLGKTNPIMGVLEQRIIFIESEIALLRTRYTDKHSKVQIKLRELGNLKMRQTELINQHDSVDTTDLDKLWQLANTLPNEGDGSESSLLVSQLVTLQDAKNQLHQEQNELQMLESQIEVLTKRLSSTTDTDKTLRQLERDYEVKQTLYRDMLSRYEMAKVTGKLVRYEGPDKVKTIERAYSPTRPINNSLVTSAIIGLILGLLTGITFIFVSTLLDNRIKDVSTIEKLTGQPVLIKIPVIADKSEVEHG